MLPLRDSTPSKHFPFITVILIAANLYIFSQELLLGPKELERLYYTLGLVPAQFTNQNNLSLIGYLPFLSSMFLHGSWMHVIGNMWILWLFGDNVEDKMGPGKFLAFYISCGIIAALTHYFVEPNSTIPVVGASGAVAGVMGAYFIMFRHARVLTLIPPFFLVTIPAWVYLGFWALSQLFSGAVGLLSANAGQIAFWAHIGGFAAGMLLYRYFLRSKQNHYPTFR